MREWLDGLRQRLAWLSGCDENTDSFLLNIEEVFHHAYFDIEIFRLKQHLATVGRGDGPATPWNYAESITAWLSHLEDALRDVILQKDVNADLDPIVRWARTVDSQDAVVTFNYDTLVERALSAVAKTWNHGTESHDGIKILKLHGSIDWIVAHRSQNFPKLDLMFEKQNLNRSGKDTGHVEDDYCLWRCRTPEQLKKWLAGRDLQVVPKDALPASVGIAGLGAYKQPHKIPGLGLVWTRGMRALYEADLCVVVGFSMSEFDTLAQMQFAEIARKRQEDGRPLRVIAVDPHMNEMTKKRFVNVFRQVDFVSSPHECIDWGRLNSKI